jgi:hypothetical protein
MTTTRILRAALRLARRAVVYEIGLWRSLFRWVTRRPTVSGSDEAFGYVAVVRPLLLTFIVVSAIEIPAVDLLLSHTLDWPALRHTAIALGVYGVLWMIGLLAAMQVHPHVVADSGLRVRSGTTVDFTVPWDAVADIAARQRSTPSGKTVEIEQVGDRRIGHVGVADQTNVDVRLRAPQGVPMREGLSEPVAELRLYADDPDALVAAARLRLPVVAPARSLPLDPRCSSG